MRLAAFLIVFLFGAVPARACGVETSCELGDRTYRILLPEKAASEPMGAIVFAHGWRGTAAGTMNNKSLRALADELGVALVAPKSAGEDWQLPGRPRHTGNTGEEEFDYFRKLIDVLEDKHGIDGNKLLMTGFSAGGMLTWTLACHMGGQFAGFAPIAGTFWAPIPESCPSEPVDLIHFHGTGDTMVPMAGRPIADTKQGDVNKALTLFIEGGDFGEAKKVTAETGLECVRRENADGRILELCTHGGGHMYEADYVKRAWTLFGIGGE